MTCEEWEIWISAYHDDALDAERRRRVEAHLAGCAPCRAQSETLAALGPMLHAAMTRVEAPETLFREVMTRLPEPAATAGRPKPVLRPPRGWLSFGLAPIGLALWLLMASQTAKVPKNGTSMAESPGVKATATQRSAVQNKVKGIGKRNPGARPAPGGASGTTPPKVSPPPSEYRPELEDLRRLQQRRPPRFQDRLVSNSGSGWRTANYRPDERCAGSSQRRHRRHRLRRPRPAETRMVLNPTPTRKTQIRNPKSPIRNPESWLSVVDYVLPQAAPETQAGEGTEFVLRPAETYQVTQTSYEY